MMGIVLNGLYTKIRKRGTTRQLAGAIVTCVISALLLLPAFLWYNVRFSSVQTATSVVEITLALVYVAVCGWVLPLGVTTSYCLFTRPRDSHTSARIPRQRKHTKRTTRGNAVAGRSPLPRRQPGVLEPCVFTDDVPLGCLGHRVGCFHGHKLAVT